MSQADLISLLQAAKGITVESALASLLVALVLIVLAIFAWRDR